MANIPEFISILRRIRDEIYPKVKEIYENTATLKSEAELSKNAAEISAAASASSAGVATTRANEIKNVSAQANTLSSGSSATVSYNSTDGKFTFGLPVGAKGDRGESYTINARGTTAGRAAYDTQSIGFSYLDISLSIVYFKISATSGDWSTGTSFGKGEDGDNGADGTGITSIAFHSTTSDNGLASQPGGIDTYRITLSNSNTYDISLANGNDLNINGYGDKTIPKDDDEFAIADSDSYFNLKKLSIGKLKSSINSGFKNYIINGDFRVNQHNSDTVAAITAAGIFACDRFYEFASQPGKITAQRRSSSAVAMGQAPFENCLQVFTVAGYSPNSAEQFNITQKIEGLNTANLRFGKSNAKTITLSFWVRSSVTGLHSVVFKNSTATRSYVATYTINSANTFEYKTITIQGDITGTWVYDNGVGLHVAINLAVGGSQSTPTPNQWVSGNYNTTTGCVNDIATTGNEFILTGVQLEEGLVATPFEQRLYGLELSLCRRYYEKLNGTLQTGTVTGAASYSSWLYKVEKRVTPTLTGSTGTSFSLGTSSATVYVTSGSPVWANGSTASAEL